MSRIKKRGLDYFPISTDFIHDRIVRRIMKSEGDAAVTVLVETLCSIYTNEGYYALADALFYEDLADNLYEKDAAYVQRVITLASEYGLFNSTLFREYGLLTSADIQRQFLFATKRRNISLIDERYYLLSPEEQTPAISSGKGKEHEEDTSKSPKANQETVPGENPQINSAFRYPPISCAVCSGAFLDIFRKGKTTKVRCPSNSFLVFCSCTIFPGTSCPYNVLIALIMDVVSFSSIFIICTYTYLLLSCKDRHFRRNLSYLTLIYYLSSPQTISF